MRIVEDKRVSFPAYYVRHRSKTEQRMFVAYLARIWLTHQHRQHMAGAIMVDIDDTLIDGNQSVQNGFQYMKELYTQMSLLFPLHIVTARPCEDHGTVMRLLAARGFCIPPDRLHMLPTRLYGKDLRHVEEFKWNTYLKIGRLHGGVVARFGDKLWDVAHLNSLRGTPWARH